MTKHQALLDWLRENGYPETEAEDIAATRCGDDSLCEAHGHEYLVLTDDEADQRCADYIKDSLWAFNPEFLAAYMPDGVDSDVLRILQEKCEGANSALLKMCTDLDGLIRDATGCDGRGHFLAGYDGEENEAGEFYIYRTN